jgi:hypothetical protein
MLTSVTVKGNVEDVRRSWEKFPPARKVKVEFEEALGNRGTIVRLRGKASATKRETIRRFKQWVETGEILITEGQPAGRKQSTSRKYDRYAA